jgi:hypothetical protein
MQLIVSYRNTTANAKHFVHDDGINIAPRCKSPRERLIELSREWSLRHAPAERRKIAPKLVPKPIAPKKPVLDSDIAANDAAKILSDNGMPGWAREAVISIAEANKVSPLDIVRQCRSREIVKVRNEIFYTLRDRASPVNGTQPSFIQIGKWMGRDHTSVTWGAAKHATVNGLPSYTGLDYERHRVTKRERHVSMRSISNGEG